MGPEAPLCELSLGPQRSGTVHLCPRGGSRTELHGQPTARHLPLVGCPTSCDVLRGQPPGPGAVALLHLCLACLSRLEVGGHSLTTLVCPACWILAWLWPGLAPCSLFLHLPCVLCTGSPTPGVQGRGFSTLPPFPAALGTCPHPILPPVAPFWVYVPCRAWGRDPFPPWPRGQVDIPLGKPGPHCPGKPRR